MKALNTRLLSVFGSSAVIVYCAASLIVLGAKPLLISKAYFDNRVIILEEISHQVR